MYDKPANKKEAVLPIKLLIVLFLLLYHALRQWAVIKSPYINMLVKVCA
jgi:hypothetical protein